MRKAVGEENPNIQVSKSQRGQRSKPFACLWEKDYRQKYSIKDPEIETFKECLGKTERLLWREWNELRSN